MQVLFDVVKAIFRNQDAETLNHMVGASLGADTVNCEYCEVEAHPTNAGVRIKASILDEETGLPKVEHKFVLVPVDGEILYRLSLAVENGMSSDEQRACGGDKLVDWTNEVCDQNHDLSQEFFESLG